MARISVLKVLANKSFRQWLRSWGKDITPFPATDENAIEAHLASLLAILDINCVLDVGANHGQYAAMLRRIGYRGRIISFEPILENFKILRDRFKDDNEWIGYQCALGAETTEQDIQITKFTVFSSFFSPNKYATDQFGDSSSVVAQERVAIKRLDDLADELTQGIATPRIFLKTDTQGYDLQVLAGANHSLEKIAGLQMELSIIPIYDSAPSYQDALHVIEQAGFTITGLYVVNRDSMLRAIELDCVCTRRDVSATRLDSSKPA